MTVNNISSNMGYCTKLIEYPTILIFDSGMGGLFVYEEIRCLLPCVYYLYFFDNEVFPYGQCSGSFILDRVINIFEKMCRRHRLDLVIIACNTVTVLVLEKLRNYFYFPIIGVVPNIQLGVQRTRNGVIGILGTHGTISSNFISNVVDHFSINYRILLLSSTELVHVAEDKILYDKIISLSVLLEILNPWLNILEQPDTIVLGCTHFLHLKNELYSVFKEKVYLVGLSRNFSFYIMWILKIHGINIRYSGIFKKYNQMYCSSRVERTLISWQPILLKYGFSSLSRISI